MSADGVDILALGLLALSAVFFLGGTVGLLRFPDTLSRLHALTKADNLGLGFLATALALIAGDPAVAVKLALVWLLVMVLSAGAVYLVARHALGRAASEPEDGRP